MTRVLLVVCVLAGCGGDDGTPRPDAPVGPGVDGGGPGVDASGGGVDGGESRLGEFCSSTEPDGGPFSCPGLVCCTSGTTICTEPDDCPGGGGYVACTMTSQCPGGRICCQLPTMTFCAKQSSCDAYGGTTLP